MSGNEENHGDAGSVCVQTDSHVTNGESSAEGMVEVTDGELYSLAPLLSCIFIMVLFIISPQSTRYCYQHSSILF